MGLGVAAVFPVFLFPAILDHVMGFLLYEVTGYIILERFTRSNDVLTLDDVYIYISLFVRIGLYCPTCIYIYILVCKVLTPVYEWICTLQKCCIGFEENSC